MSKENTSDQDWPADPANADLLRLVDQLHEAAPPLSVDALARVQQQLQAELDRAQGWRRRRRLTFGLGIAAAVLVAIGGYLMLSTATQPNIAKPQPHQAPALVEDRITIAIGEGGPGAVGKPLIPLDEYGSLFAD